MKSTKNKIIEGALVALLFFTFVIPIIPVQAHQYWEDHHKIHTTEETVQRAIPFEKEEEESEDHEVGHREITTAGEEGTEVITYAVRTKNGKEISRTETDRRVADKPVTEVTTVGTHEPEEDNYYPVYRTGAICADGSYSYATGSGACSWHGGVWRWQY